MTLGSKMNDGAGLVIPQEISYQLPVGDVSLEEGVAVVREDRLEVANVPRIRKLVEIDDVTTFRGQPLEDKIRTDKPGSSRDKNRLFLHLIIPGKVSNVDYVSSSGAAHRNLAYLKRPRAYD
jgi:hypothetical protein